MLPRLILAVWLLFASMCASAFEYTDVYYNPDESGWGVFLVQSDITQFLAFFIYGPDNKPVWYTAILEQKANGNFDGPLYATTGTYFANPWTGYSFVEAGTVSFRPIDTYHATLNYTLTGVPTVTKTVQRQTLTSYALAGNYSGSMSGTISGCADPTGNEPAFRARYNLAVAQVGDTSATLTFTFVDTDHSGLVCTVSGPLTHLGRLYRMVNAQTTCVGQGIDPGPFADTIESFHPTGQGIEGRWNGPQGEGCTLSLRFSAVRNN